MEGRRFNNDRGNNSGGRNFGGNNRGGNFRRNNNFDRSPREMHKATCSSCKKECEVPFKPTEGRDVFCQDCFKKNNPRD